MIKGLIEELHSKRNFFCDPEGADDTAINGIEKQLGVALPKSYREFIRQCGFAMWFGHRLCGVSAHKECDVVFQTMKARQVELPDSSFRRVPEDGVVIEPYGGGGWFFLFSEESSRSGQVALFTHEALGQAVEHWNSFEDFVRHKLSVST
jgi:hypothetical protein